MTDDEKREKAKVIYGKKWITETMVTRKPKSDWLLRLEAEQNKSSNEIRKCNV